MDSSIAKAICLQFDPIAILWSDEKPAEAIQFKVGSWGCVMWQFAQAAKGKTTVFDRQTFGCVGGGTGLGFGAQYVNAPGGIDGFSYFLSTGIESCEDPEKFAGLLNKFTRPEQRDNFLKGERFKKNPELVKKFIETLPIVNIPAEYIIFKPLANLKKDEEPVVVVFVANPNQISALVTLANYSRADPDTVIVPSGAACHQILIYAYKEARSDKPRAVLGLTDIAARNSMRKLLGDDVFTFAVPYKMFIQMETDVKGSFLEGPTWKNLMSEEVSK
ncbi:MAG: DUF169 domain-containing protein [Methanotrichaceae archaeon]|nr:DUF169 domain-containing protein [Methanotrichaceae archaeon]